MSNENYIDIVLDGPPSYESGRFVEVEDHRGIGISVGEWIQRENGYWALRIPRPNPVDPDPTQPLRIPAGELTAHHRGWCTTGPLGGPITEIHHSDRIHVTLHRRNRVHLHFEHNEIIEITRVAQ